MSTGIYYVDNRDITDPRRNLALEEYVLRNHRCEGDILLFYVNEPSVIIGKHQNTIEEIDPAYIRSRGIHVVRRISGGGAVYHDLGNLNFSFITAYRPERFNRYEEFTRPVIDVLRALGVPAELGGRNDILVEGRKISGNAQFSTRDRMLSHGTVLLDSDLDAVTAALRVRPGKIESKGIKSVRSRVANISEYLREPITTRQLRDLVLERMFGSLDDVRHYELNPEDWERVEELVERRYATWEWNHGESPRFNLQRAHRFPGGEVDVRLSVEEGRIHCARIYGDYMGVGDVEELERALVGLRYDRDELERVLARFDVTALLGGVTAEELLDLLHG